MSGYLTVNHLLFSIFLLITASCSFSKLSRTKYIPPVVLIPGDGGSQIEAKIDKPSVIHYICQKKSDWFDLWLNMELLVPYVIDCWVDNMRLVYDNVTRTTTNSPGVQTRIPGFGNSSTVEWLDPSQRSPTGYFKDIVNAISTLGYERGVTVRGAPFDFRKAPNELGDYFLMLRQLIEETYVYTGRKIVLILHSMGAPMTHYFLNRQPQAWKDRYIETVVSLAGAWGGSIKAVKVYTAGDNLGIYVINAMKVRTEQRSAPSLAFLLPSDEIWGENETLVQTPAKNYSTWNFKDLFEDLNLPDALNMYLDTKDLLRNAPAPGVEIHCLHGEEVKTVEKLIYAEGQFPDNPVIVYGGGDGTVNTLSAQRCLNWSDKQKNKIYYKTFSGVDHMQILRDKGSIGYIVELLSNITKTNERQAKRKMSYLERKEKRKENELLGDHNTENEVAINANENELNSENKERSGTGNGILATITVPQQKKVLLGNGL
nr:phospholipase A2 group XV-like isoform X1 [Cherax quadricarinatus]